MSVLMAGGLVGDFMWISLRLGGSVYQTPIVHYRMNVRRHQMLQFDWSICVTCECIIRGSGMSYNFQDQIVKHYVNLNDK